MKKFFLILIALILILSSAAGIANEITKVYVYGKPFIINKDTAIIDGRIQSGVSTMPIPAGMEVETVSSAAAATVRVTAFAGAGRANTGGSGFNLSPEGLIITCAHVVDEAKSVRVTFRSGASFPVTVKAIDSQKDVAILSLDVPRDDLPAVALGDSLDVRVGDEIVILGYPLGDFLVTAGTIERLSPPAQGDYLAPTLHISAAVMQGNSGGPVLARDGKVVGIITGSYTRQTDSQTHRFGVAVPINEATRLLNN